MKKIYLLITIFALMLAGCGDSNDVSNKKDETSSKKAAKSTKNVAENDSSTTSEADTEGENISKEADSASENSNVLEPADTTKDSDATEQTTSPINEDSTTKQQAQVSTTTEPQTQESATTKPQAQESTTTKPQTQTPTTTPAPTQPATEATTSKHIVDYTEETSSRTENYKYGVKKTITTTNYYEVYSDGSKVLYYTSEHSSYDTSDYSATDAELLNESNTKSTANMAYYNEVLTLVNEIRAEAGVAPLTLDTTLCQAATMRAVEMNYSNIFSHTRPDGSDCFTVFGTYNISYMSCGENIAAGYASPSAVVTGWKNSSGHYANMINENFTKLGVGMSNEAPGSYGIYWVQLFTS